MMDQDQATSKPLQDKVAVVMGASKGAGRGIAVELGLAGAVVYVIARSVRGKTTPGYEPTQTIEDTAEMIEARGGAAIPVQADCLQIDQVSALFERIKKEQGHVDILVNSAWEDLWFWHDKFWEHPLEKGLKLMELGLHAPIIAGRFAAPLMFGREAGLIVTVTDVDEDGCLYYRMVMSGARKMTRTIAEELRPHYVAAIALRSGYMVFHEEIKEGVETTDPEFEKRHHPRFNGRAVVALAAAKNLMEKTGQVHDVSDLAFEYGFTDIDGRQPLMFC